MMMRRALKTPLTSRSLCTAAPEAHPACPPSLVLKPRFDFKKIVENAAQLEENVAKRKHPDVDVKKLVSLYHHHYDLVGKVTVLRKERNTLADRLSSANVTDRAALVEKGKEVREALKKVEDEADRINTGLLEEALKLPNDTHPAVPLEEQKELKFIGTRPTFNFKTLTHEEIAARWDLIDFETASKISGGKFHYLKNEAAELELALVMWAMQFLRKRGFTPVLTPDIIRPAFAEAAGFRPRSEASQGHDMCLIGTSEITLAGLHSDKLYQPSDLAHFPLRHVGFSHCFRAEATHRGKMSRGLYRVHQFSKVEMFVVAKPEQSNEIHEQLMAIQCELIGQLGLHARVLDMPAHDLGASAYRKFDIEAWLPSREDYGEVTSASNCTDYQSRRLGIRYKEVGAPQSEFVHTLNATAAATPRLIMAILENFQLPDGTVKLPDVLVSFMGRTHIGGKK